MYAYIVLMLVFLSRGDPNDLEELKQKNRVRSRKFHIVTEEWVKDCIKAGKLLKERSYEPSA